ncbi:MAG TPA: NAD(P)/FAD-dependent oxidoreductase [Streptosporangiaceae bacterium]
MTGSAVDAVVIGAGPNGLAAAITLAQAGLEVAVHEAADTVGGGARTEELTLPGFRHDPCSAVHPLGAGSPLFRSWPLAEHGLDWIQPGLPLAHPFLDGPAVTLARSVAETVDSLDPDGRKYHRLVRPFLGRWDELAPSVLRAPLDGLPPHPLLLAAFGLPAAAPAALLARRFRGHRARGLLAGMAAHVTAPLTAPVTGGIALMFALAAHAVGWPIPRGGTQAVSDALAGLLTSLGGTITTGHRVQSLDELPPARAYLFDTGPEQLAAIAGARLPAAYAHRLSRYQHGPGVFKIDYALSGPVPWLAADCHRAGTVHLGPTLEEIGGALRTVHRGQAPDPPFLITAQPSRFDPARAPAGQHTFWVYCQVPNGWDRDHTEAIETQIERFAPGFRDLVLARTVTAPAGLQARNANYVGGDIAVGRCDQFRLLFRPTFARVPYATPDPAIFLCSAATPPGPGVHGMCGYHAAATALRRVFQRPVPSPTSLTTIKA